MNRLQRLLAARPAEIDADRLAARIEASDHVAAEDGPSIDEDALVRLAAAVRQLGADAPVPTDATELRRVVLARAVGARGQVRRFRLATSGVVMLVVAAAVTVPAWGPSVGSALAPVVEWFWRAPGPDGPRGPVLTPPGPSDGLPLSPPDGPPVGQSAAPSAEADGPPRSSSPDEPGESPSLASPRPPTSPTSTVAPPSVSPPAPTPLEVSPPAPTPPVALPPVPSPPTLPPPPSPGPGSAAA
ncbi:MAG TPA: hypothetical protein VMQ65_03415 [Candidatus Limnocylindria bacterium]|nr:hypothetical protein [Candidatus Limnocylindria bacterium]